jgi:hypothetical protein
MNKYHSHISISSASESSCDKVRSLFSVVFEVRVWRFDIEMRVRWWRNKRNKVQIERKYQAQLNIKIMVECMKKLRRKSRPCKVYDPIGLQA